MALPSPEAVGAEVSARANGGGQESEVTQQDNQTDAAPNTDGKTAEDVLNLDGVMKFKFGDREWSPDQLKKAIMFQQDYTKKTTALSESKKYWDNLEYDLDKIKKNPQLAGEFVKVYPKQFHNYLKLVQAGSEQAQDLQTQSQYAQIDPKIVQEFEQIRDFVKDSQVKAHEAQLDAKFSTLSKKYPEAVEDVVLARAQALLDKGQDVDDKTWETLFKQSHDYFAKKFEDKQKGILQTQRSANNSAKGPASGGGVPTHAPRRETMSQATDRAIRELSNRR